MTCTILFELRASEERRATRTRFDVEGVSTEEFWKTDRTAFGEDVERLETIHGTIDAGASMTRARRNATWDFCSQEVRDGDGLIRKIVDLLRQRYGWTITKRER